MNEKLYGELAAWWPLLSSPDDYEEEADFFLKHFGGKEGSTMLELGCGGGIQNAAETIKVCLVTFMISGCSVASPSAIISVGLPNAGANDDPTFVRVDALRQREPRQPKREQEHAAG